MPKPTIAQQLAELDNQRKALARNLNTMGVQARENEKLNTLVPKVLDIQTGTAIQKIPVPTVSGTYSYTGSNQTVQLNNYSSDKINMTGESTASAVGTHTVYLTPKYGYAWENETYEQKSLTWTINKAPCSLSLNKSSVTVTGSSPTAAITVTRAGTGAISAVSSDENVVEVSVSGNTITVTGKTDGSATITVSVAETSNYTGDSKTISVTASNMVHIYGAEWSGSSSTAWTRTDSAAGLSDPIPYVAGAASYSSPFDNKMPWSGMVKEERTGGTMVKIPKFWYKITQSGNSIKIQIADNAVSGYSVSPAHKDRGDGKGERDFAYIGRYHCGNSNYKSATGQKPKANITRSAARTAIHNLGTNIWQADFAMRFTIWLLYIVEFADWNSQNTIGYGCGNNSGTENMGYTDSMPYHTGTTLSSRTAKGIGTQYRYIEGLWDNVYDWTDGVYYNSNGMNIILNPNNFSDSSGGTSVGKPTSGWPFKFSVKNVYGAFPIFIPSESNGGETTGSCDYWSFSSSYPCVCVGGDCGQGGSLGLFCVNYGGVSNSNGSIGSRLQELP